MKIKSFFIFIILLFCIAYFGKRVYFHFTDGFRLSHIHSHLEDRPEWQLTPPTSTEFVEIHHALDQPYYYLAKGHQAYAFMSKDNHYIIKFLKFHRNRLQPWTDYLPNLVIIEKYLDKRRAFKDNRMSLLLKSWKMANEELKQENGLLLVHINTTQNLYPHLVIIDKIGRKYSIDLDQTTFLLQRKALLFQEAIDEDMENQRVDLAQQRIDQYLKLIQSEYARGLAETDHRVLRNTGFVKEQAIHIDAGRFSKNEEFKNQERQKIELHKKTKELDQWLQKKHPDLAHYLEKQLNNR